MSKRQSFARHWTLPVLSALCAVCCLTPVQAQENNGDIQHVTMHLSNLPFVQALELMGKSANIKFHIPPDLVARIDPNVKYNVDISNGAFSEALDYLLDQVDPPLAYHVENGAYVLEASKKPRIGKAQKKPRVIQHITYDVKDRPFEDAVGDLFHEARLRYRIDPAVTAYRDPVSFSVEDATLEQKLAALLAAVPGQKTPLVFHKEKDIYVITPKDKAQLPDSNNTPIGLPSYHPEPIIKTVAISNEHPGVALHQIFSQATTNYHFVQPSSVADTPRITFAMQGVPLEQAIVHLLRSAPTEPPFGIAIYIDPDDPKQVPVYSVDTNRFYTPHGSPALVYHHWFGFQDYDLYSALKMVLANSNQSYTIDPALRQVRITAKGNDLPSEKAINKLLEASPIPVKFSVTDNVYQFWLLKNTAPRRKP